MVKCGIVFEVRSEFLSTIWTSIGCKGLRVWSIRGNRWITTVNVRMRHTWPHLSCNAKAEIEYWVCHNVVFWIHRSLFLRCLICRFEIRWQSVVIQSVLANEVRGDSYKRCLAPPVLWRTTERVSETECEVQPIGMRLFAVLVRTSSDFVPVPRRIPDTCSLTSSAGVTHR
jgi:hypothetical protein